MTDSSAFKIVMEALAKQKPVILHDAHDTGHYILLLKSATESTLDIDTRLPSAHPMAGDRLVDGLLETTRPALEWLVHNNLMTYPPEPHTISLDGRHVTGVVMPGGQPAIKALQKACEKNGITNPFTIFETTSDRGMIDFILSAQGIGSGIEGRG